jgi:hypothetical protein
MILYRALGEHEPAVLDSLKALPDSRRIEGTSGCFNHPRERNTGGGDFPLQCMLIAAKWLLQANDTYALQIAGTRSEERASALIGCAPGAREPGALETIARIFPLYRLVGSPGLSPDNCLGGMTETSDATRLQTADVPLVFSGKKP